MKRRVSRPLLAVVLATLAMGGAAPLAMAACPFCDTVAQTFTEEIMATDIVVVAELVQPPPPPKQDGDRFSSDISKARFKILEVVRGGEQVAPGDLLETIYFGSAKKGSTFLVMGVDPPEVQWSTPSPLSERGRMYVKTILTLPKEGVDRLLFFQQYLEDEDEMLARDAYDEFARAPYDDVKAMKTKMDHAQLVAWIKDVDIPPSRRRLYLTMLGVCGSDQDLPMLEKLMRSTDQREKSGLDAMVACYLTLAGAEGMPVVEELFLKNKDAEYSDTYSAIMALRFHATEGGVIDKERILKGLHLMLERPQLADLIIPDLARMEDWSQLAKLVELFKNADPKSSWVRVPVINYVRACPKPEAKQLLEELEKIDPEAMQRARTFFPFSPNQGDGGDQ